MSPYDETAARARLAEKFREIQALARANTALELDLLLHLEAELDAIAADPASLAVVRQLGAELNLDLTSRAAIERRRAKLEKLLDLGSGRDGGGQLH